MQISEHHLNFKKKIIAIIKESCTIINGRGQIRRMKEIFSIHLDDK